MPSPTPIRTAIQLGGGIFVLMLVALSIKAQATCPAKTVKVDAIRGIVVENSLSRAVVPNVLVELIQVRDNDQLISSVTTDEKGWFQFDRVSRGSYVLAFSHPFLGPYRLGVKARGGNPPAKGSSIKVMLGPDCFTTEVILGK